MSYTTIQVTVGLRVPTVPNFFRFQRVDQEDGTIPIGDIPDVALEKIGAEWTHNLVERAKEQRASS